MTRTKLAIIMLSAAVVVALIVASCFWKPTFELKPTLDLTNTAQPCHEIPYRPESQPSTEPTK